MKCRFGKANCLIPYDAGLLLARLGCFVHDRDHVRLEANL